MSTYMLLCNFTEQGVRTIKEMPQRRAAARELGKKFGVDIKAGYLAMGAYDLIIHAEATDDVAAIGNVRTTSVKVFPEADVDKIIAGLA